MTTSLSARSYLIAAHLGVRPSDLNPVEAHELAEAFDQMTETRTSPGQDRSRGHASETGVNARPDTEPTPDTTSGPGTSRTVEQSGAGRAPGDWQHTLIGLEDALEALQRWDGNA